MLIDWPWSRPAGRASATTKLLRVLTGQAWQATQRLHVGEARHHQDGSHGIEHAGHFAFALSVLFDAIALGKLSNSVTKLCIA